MKTKNSIGKQWYRVAGDELLWKQFLICDYKLAARRTTIVLSPFCNNSYRLEYKRFAALAPIRLSQTLNTHKDEVLHVAFSPDGTMFATASKDCTLQVWRRVYFITNVQMFTDGVNRFCSCLRYFKNIL